MVSASVHLPRAGVEPHWKACAVAWRSASTVPLSHAEVAVTVETEPVVTSGADAGTTAVHVREPVALPPPLPADTCTHALEPA
jgi:hypothetical protein